MNVYLVEIGKYSDRMIVAAYSNEDHAQRLVDACKSTYNDARIICVEVDAEPAPPAGSRPYLVEMDPDGNAYEVCEREYFDQNHVVEDYGGYLSIYCLATDEKHAVKIASEKRIQHKLSRD